MKFSYLLGRCISVFILVVATCFLFGCGQQAKIDEQLRVSTAKAEASLQQLSKELRDGRVNNALILQEYASRLSAQKPDLAPLANALARDAAPSGPMFFALKERLAEASNPDYLGDWRARLQELQLIEQAASRQLFNDALSDPVNVLADLSAGQLPRVNAVNRETTLTANRSKDFGPGSQLVGNPQYGQWRSDSRGLSFWEWYGMYSLFSNVTGMTGFGRPYYHTWAGNRDYSYYHDYGRGTYSSRNQRSRQAALETRTKKSFQSQGKRFQSPYSKSRAGSSALSRKSTIAKSNYSRTKSGLSSSPKSKGSAFGKSSYSSNFRSGYSRSSRGFSGGK